nr:MAG TPA: hypothetical protein [Bacteriophage sp.]
MKKDEMINELVNLGISDEVAKFVFSDTRNNKALNAEGMEIGDEITIKGIADKPSESVIDGVSRQWVDVLTTGDRASISIARLVGTAKRAKYFNARPETTFIAGGFDESKVLTLPMREGDALKAVAKLIGKTYKVVAIAENCGTVYAQTYYLFAEV